MITKFDSISQEEQNRRMSAHLKMNVTNVYHYGDGFSFTVPTELEAYKAAYRYQGPNIEKTVVKETPLCGWSVAIYRKEA